MSQKFGESYSDIRLLVDGWVQCVGEEKGFKIGGTLPEPPVLIPDFLSIWQKQTKLKPNLFMLDVICTTNPLKMRTHLECCIWAYIYS